MKSLFEQMGGTYTLQGDYYFPNLSLPAEENKPIGIWGQRHLRYIQHHRKVFYTNLLASGRMNSYLADIDSVGVQGATRLKPCNSGHLLRYLRSVYVQYTSFICLADDRNCYG